MLTQSASRDWLRKAGSVPVMMPVKFCMCYGILDRLISGKVTETDDEVNASLCAGRTRYRLCIRQRPAKIHRFRPTGKASLGHENYCASIPQPAGADGAGFHFAAPA